MTLPAALKELQQLNQWVYYRKDPRTGRIDKMPLNPATGKGADASDPKTWGTFEQAKKRAAESGGGIGFELGASGYCGVDLDHCVRTDGSLEPYAQQIVEQLNSYTEYSPSGTGIHILCKFSKFGSIKKKEIEIYRPRSRTEDEKKEAFRLDQMKPVDKQRYKSAQDVGTVHQGRYLTVTGNVYGTERPIACVDGLLEPIIDKYKPQQKAAQRATAKPTDGNTSAPSSVNELLSLISRKARNGAQIMALYRGEWQGAYPSQSEADASLCSHLAYWTNGNPDLMDQAFRASGLMREKWDRQTGASTYGQMTIDHALSSFTPYTKPTYTSSTNSRFFDWDDVITEDTPPVASGSVVIKEAKETPPLDWSTLSNPTESQTQPDSVLDYLNGSMAGEIKEFGKYAGRKTGFSNLDETTNLYPGLYVIGAISSLGKTTFTHQMADQLAQRGEHVLFFSLEQSRLEVVSKSLARETAKATGKEAGAYRYRFDKKQTMTSLEIRKGRKSEALEAATERYKAYAGNLSVIECDFQTKASDIVRYTEKYMKQNPDTPPVVIVDYLQILQPMDSKMTTKDAVDQNVRALKMLQRDNDLVVIVICSMNRQNYLTPVDFESFKESGGIEYTADVVWGLQLYVINESIFDSQQKLKAKRAKIKKAKAESPRKIELVCLKNRYGKSSYSCYFHYYPQHDYFVPIPEDDLFRAGWEKPLEDDDEIK